MGLWISFVFNFFLVLFSEIFFWKETISVGVKLFCSPREFFFCPETLSFSTRLFPCRETFSLGVRVFFFPVRLFLLPWDFFFSSQSFSSLVRLFLLPWDILFHGKTFYFPHRNVSPENYFWSTIKEGFDRLYSLRLVLQARHFYSPEKEEVKREKRLW